MQIPPLLASLARDSGVSATAANKDWRAAQGFAGMAIGELLQPMFSTVHLSKTRFGGGLGAATWKPVLVAAIGREIAQRDSLGIGAAVFRALVDHQEGQESTPPEGLGRG